MGGGHHLWGGGVTSAEEHGRLIFIVLIVMCSVGGFSPPGVANSWFWQHSHIRK